MNSLLHIAARVEAAVASYVSVRDVADRAEWERRFEEEKVLTTREFRRLRRNSGDLPALHPTLAALYIVLDAKGDLSDIGRGHPSINKHKYYLPSAKFPADISHLLPPNEGRWWEHLAAEHGDGGVPAGNAAPSPTPPPPPPPSPPRRHLLKVTLIMGPPPEDSEDEMEVDQLEESPEPPSIHKKGKKKAAGSAATSRKRKLTSPPPRRSKKQNVPVRLPPKVIGDELESEDEDEDDDEDDLIRFRSNSNSAAAIVLSGTNLSSWFSTQSSRVSTLRCDCLGVPPVQFANLHLGLVVSDKSYRYNDEYEFSCERCIKANVHCEPQPTAPCLRCQSSKVGCSLMLPNSKTGKTDRRHLKPEVVRRYRIAQYKVREGKQPAAAYRKTSEASDSAASASRLVEGLTLYSTSSNAASPASLAPTAPDSPTSPNPSATDTTATATAAAAAGPSAPAAAAGAADATPAITPSLRRRLQPARRLVPVVEVPMPSHLVLSSSRQRSGVSAAQAPQEVPEHNSAERIQHLEMRLADVEEKLEVLMKGSGA
ncbi:hypothetical protein H4582DRAFT_2064326 [Lactarius indigo]|nr:hypothetical protein H4582DRAFT_2064326 [Lactarius indigo]